MRLRWWRSGLKGRGFEAGVHATAVMGRAWSIGSGDQRWAGCGDWGWRGDWERIARLGRG